MFEDTFIRGGDAQQVPCSELELDGKAVLRGEGADPEQIYSRRPQLAEVADRALKIGLPLVSPMFYRCHVEIDKSKQQVLKLFNGQDWLQSYLKNAGTVDFVICTIGPDLENLSSKTMAEDGPLALALDGLANAAVDRLAAYICEMISHEAESRKFQASLPLGPGMPEWPVEQGQPLIFQIIKPDDHIVRLTDSHLMIPRKSNSFIVVSGKDIHWHGKMCDFCNLRETCRYKIRKSEIS